VPGPAPDDPARKETPAQKRARQRRQRSRSSYASSIKRLYGVSIEEYEAMVAAQDNRCYLCGRRQVRKRLAIDHDHRTGIRRDILCQVCNRTVIGILCAESTRGYDGIRAYGQALINYANRHDPALKAG
jgi:Recombination endonuclease VII